jgi:hypothetical protein
MTERPKTTFTITLRGQEVRVEYTARYFTEMDHFAFRSPHEPPRPIPVSETGYLSEFANVAEVKAAGGPEAYALKYAEAEMAQQKRPRKVKKAEGGHAARVKETPPSRPEAQAADEAPPTDEGHAAREEKRTYTQRDLF